MNLIFFIFLKNIFATMSFINYLPEDYTVNQITDLFISTNNLFFIFGNFNKDEEKRINGFKDGDYNSFNCFIAHILDKVYKNAHIYTTIDSLKNRYKENLLTENEIIASILDPKYNNIGVLILEKKNILYFLDLIKENKKRCIFINTNIKTVPPFYFKEDLISYTNNCNNQGIVSVAGKKYFCKCNMDYCGVGCEKKKNHILLNWCIFILTFFFVLNYFYRSNKKSEIVKSYLVVRKEKID
ncbi:hypothetical protein CWI37_0514p0020 [Hamiltosporidium tvaerminnensis]|uniref:EGF-like domain-containing protein n=2 Tax=Hamiltosporidium TaxID=1176354 RepID=A0A4Q9L553_9MICR|nr:hypothetical protein LUQ84_3463 [Hamiltosporidium tvaerminnensis]TBU02292.1 hypothetical protein CWI37_0514p0020 [Hamiltosporidium tvaerminnensis]TBU02699.1 hypothetical protein CWI39_1104p0010 [Hamiltosporidium magnivora]